MFATLASTKLLIAPLVGFAIGIVLVRMAGNRIITGSSMRQLCGVILMLMVPLFIALVTLLVWAAWSMNSFTGLDLDRTPVYIMWGAVGVVILCFLAAVGLIVQQIIRADDSALLYNIKGDMVVAAAKLLADGSDVNRGLISTTVRVGENAIRVSRAPAGCSVRVRGSERDDRRAVLRSLLINVVDALDERREDVAIHADGDLRGEHAAHAGR